MCTTRWPPSEAHHFATITSRVASRPAVESPRRLPQRDPHRLGVDVRVGGLERDALERRQRPAELLALRRVVGGHAQRALRHADLRRAQPDERAIQHPPRARGARRPASCSAGAPAKARCATFDRSVVAATVRSTPGPAGSTRNTPSSPSPVDAGTRTRSATWAAGTLGFSPSSRQVSPSRVAVTWGRSGSLAPGSARAAVSTTSPLATPGSHARCCSGEPNSAIGQRAEHERRPQRHGCHAPSLLLEEQAELGEAETAAAVLLGDGDGEQPGVGEGAPQLAVDALVAALDLLHPLDGVACPSKTCAARSRTASCSSENVKSITCPRRVGSAGRPGGSGRGRGRPTRPRPACRPGCRSARRR